MLISDLKENVRINALKKDYHQKKFLQLKYSKSLGKMFFLHLTFAGARLLNYYFRSETSIILWIF